MNNKWIVWGCSGSALIGVDQFTKYKAYTHAYTHMHPFCGIFSVDYARNIGISCGLGQEYPPFFILFLTIALTCTLGYLWYVYRLHYTTLSVGLFLVVIGSVSNIIDRLTKGGVIDWIAFGAGGYEFPFLFNVADCAIVCGVLCIGYWMYADS